jgi:hypothetical protein
MKLNHVQSWGLGIFIIFIDCMMLCQFALLKTMLVSPAYLGRPMFLLLLGLYITIFSVIALSSVRKTRYIQIGILRFH